MADPTPIQQRIELLAETQGAKEVVRELDKLDARYKAEIEQTERSAQAARRKEQQSSRLAAKLRELVAEQAKAERETRDGVAQDNRAVEAARRREQQVERLSRALAVEEDRQEDLNRRVRESISSHRAAAQGADENAQALGRADGAAGRMAGSVANMVTGLVGTGGLLLALRLVTAELENIKRAQADAFEEQDTLASAQRQLKRNLVNATDAEIQQAIEGANTIATDRKVPNEIITRAVADGLSSTNGDIARTLANTDLAARYLADDPSQIPFIAGGLGDIQAATGLDDPEAALGYLLTTTGQSRITDASKAATNIPPAVQAAIAAGFSPEEAAALFSTITTNTTDRQGESSRTAVIQFAPQLQEFFEERGRAERGGAAIDVLRGDAALRGEFLSGLNIEARARETAAQLVTPGTVAASAFDGRQAAFGDTDALRQTAQDKLRQLESGDLEQTASLNRLLTSGTEQLQAGNVGFGRIGAVQNNIVELLRASGSSDLGNKIAGLQFDLDSFESSDAALEKLDELLEQRVLSILLDASSGSVGKLEADGMGDRILQEGLRGAANDDQRRAVEELEKLLDELNEVRGLGPENIPGDPLQRLDRAERRRQDQIRRYRERQQSNLGDAGDFGLDELTPSVAPRVVNHGTLILNAGDPLFDDLNGRDRLA